MKKIFLLTLLLSLSSLLAMADEQKKVIVSNDDTEKTIELGYCNLFVRLHSDESETGTVTVELENLDESKVLIVFDRAYTEKAIKKQSKTMSIVFDKTFGEGTVSSEQEFRQKIADQISQQFTADSDYKFLQDVRAHMEKKVGKLDMPEALLKRFMLQRNKDKGADFVEKNFDASINELRWHLIKEKLVNAQGIKVDDADLKNVAREAARAQFAQYGMSNVPDEYLDNYAEDMLKKQEYSEGLVERAIDLKLTAALKQVVKLDEKNISLEDFQKMLNEK